jgi:DNA-binding transcriptional regulator YiaG
MTKRISSNAGTTTNSTPAKVKPRTKWSELRERMAPAHREAAAARTAQMVAEMPLDELRHARHLSQAALAATLGTGQAAVSKLERRADMYVSTLRSIIEAMGGQLTIVASFPDGDVRINQFAMTPGTSEYRMPEPSTLHVSEHKGRSPSRKPRRKRGS